MSVPSKLSLPRRITPGNRSLDTTGGRVLAIAIALAPLLVALMTFLVFLPTIGGIFLDWDDEETLVQNPNYRGLGWPNIRWMFTTTLMGHWIPVTWITFAIDYLIWGMNPLGYHLTNVLLHTAASGVFYFVALHLLRAGQSDRPDATLRAAAVAAALFFSIHPLRLESVAWVTERRDVLSGLWFMLTILTYLKAVSGEGRRAWWLAGSVGCYALAIGSKGIVMTLPAVLILLDVYPLQRLAGGWRRWTSREARSIWAEKIPFVILAAVGAGMAMYAGRSVADSLHARPLSGRLATAAYGLMFYIRKTIVPLGIWPLHEIPSKVDPFAPVMVASALAVVILTTILILVRRACPAGLAAWVCYAIVLAPVSGIMQSGPQLVAARYSYLSCLSWALLIGGAVCFLSRATTAAPVGATWYRRAGSVVLVVWLAVLGPLTWRQSHVWRDSLTFWSYGASVAPTSSIAQSNLAVALIREGRVSEARPHLEAALRLNPYYTEALANLAGVLNDQGHLVEAEQALGRLGFSLLRRGKLDQAIVVLKAAVEIQPADAVAHNSLGLALFLHGDHEAAIEHFRLAVANNPKFDEARQNLYRALAQMKR